MNVTSEIKVLLIEDDRELREGFEVSLCESGFDVTAAADEQALLAVRGCSPDVLVIDLDLQSGAAWNLYADWKGRHPKLLTVALTAMPNRFGVARAVGINALMEKPIEPSLLTLIVSSLVDEAARQALSQEPTRFDFRYLTRADARYWRGLRGRAARARLSCAAR